MDLSLRNLERAVSIRRQIDRLQSTLNSLLHGASTVISGTRSRSRRPMSAKTRAKLAAAARARWAKRKGGVRSRTSARGRKKSGLTPAGRRKLSQMMKARWAARRRAAGRR